MKTIIAVAAALVAVPAAAQQNADRTPSIAAPAQPGGGVAAKPKPTRYCVKTLYTNSRIVRTACRTRKAWLASGYDPLVDLNK